MTATQSPAVVPADPATAGHTSGQVELPGGGEAVPGGRGDATAGTAALRIVGLDLSLNSTGVAGDGWTERIRPPASFTGIRRMRHIRACVLNFTRHAQLVIVEDLVPSGIANAYSLERAGLWWLIREAHDACGVPVATVKPSSIKKYATGNGRAGKDDVLSAACRRIPGFEGGNDESDAAWAAAMGRDHYQGVRLVPAAHAVSLAAVSWPAVT